MREEGNRKGKPKSSRSLPLISPSIVTSGYRTQGTTGHSILLRVWVHKYSLCAESCSRCWENSNEENMVLIVLRDGEVSQVIICVMYTNGNGLR